ncbi:MAG TPA: glycosyltransferase family 2 protein [Desulfobacteraceae bacterium]|nr:glycosyltransferase family 2 protein [Desulfobacteraceae bacterium]
MNFRYDVLGFYEHGMANLEIIFWLCFFSILYPYLGYPFFLLVLSTIRNKPVKKENISPFVSLVISAYNEEKIIAKKIENSLQLDYPEDRLEIAVISDGSLDTTNNIITEYAKRDHRIRPCISPVNKGKTSCLNDFVPLLKGEVILFTDANSLFDAGAIYNIVRPFADPVVGFVTGITKYFTLSKGQETKAINIYSRLELLIKYLESKIGSCVGADGAIFAIRKNLFVPMNPHDINDLVIPMSIIKQGYRGIVEKDAFCREKAADELEGEFNRQVRITARTLRAIFNHNSLLNPFNYPVFSFEIFSHKLMKFTTPFWIIVIFITNIYLAGQDILFYQFVMALQLLFYLSAVAGFFIKSNSRKARLINLTSSYFLVNLAYTFGWFKYFSKETYTYWVPER